MNGWAGQALVCSLETVDKWCFIEEWSIEGNESVSVPALGYVN